MNPREILAELVDLRDATVVDVGCGDGALVRWLAGRGAHAVGVEVGGAALEQARAAEPVADERYVEGGGEDLPVPDASADVVTFIQSLHHVPSGSMGRALQEAARVLRPGGVVFVQEPLAHGDQFDVLQPLDDETEVRREAQEALADLPRTLRSEHVISLDPRVPYAGFEELRDIVVRNDPARAARLPEVEGEMRARFERLARREDDAGGFTLRAPLKLDLLRRTTT